MSTSSKVLLFALPSLFFASIQRLLCLRTSPPSVPLLSCNWTLCGWWCVQPILVHYPLSSQSSWMTRWAVSCEKGQHGGQHLSQGGSLCWGWNRRHCWSSQTCPFLVSVLWPLDHIPLDFFFSSPVWKSLCKIAELFFSKGFKAFNLCLIVRKLFWKRTVLKMLLVRTLFSQENDYICFCTLRCSCDQTSINTYLVRHSYVKETMSYVAQVSLI